MRDISAYKETGERTIQQVEPVLQNSSFQEDWVPVGLPACLRRLRDAAKRTVELASSPVKIGVMGEFNSGKTLLIGSLIGFADALPTSEIPTTGNVTAIHLTQQTDLQTTQFGSITVEYLSSADVTSCFFFMLEEVEKRAKASGVSCSQLASLKGSGSLENVHLENLLQWSGTTWNESRNLELRYLLRELVQLIQACRAYGAMLSGCRYVVDKGTIEEGLKLPISDDIQNLSFTQVSNELVPLQNPPQQLTPRLLQLSFPLIRRVELEVKVSKQIWDLTALREVDEFILLDFPGLGAATSGVRDMFLSFNELADVQTILILLNATTPGNDRANRILTMMQQRHLGQDLKDRILVGIGRFDQLPLNNEGGQRALDELIGEFDEGNPFENSQFEELLSMSSPAADLPPITDVDVLSTLPVLRTTITAAQSLTHHKEKIVLLSPLLGLAHQARQFTSIQAGSDKFLTDLHYPGFLNQAKDMSEKWGKLGERLQQTEPHSTLARQFHDFSQDGGVARLRELLREHVESHGLSQLKEDVRRAGETLSRERNNLKEILHEIPNVMPVVDNQAVAELGKTVRELMLIYSEQRERIAKEPLRDHNQVFVSKVVYDELACRVFQWDQWYSLFQRTDENGIIRPPDSTNSLTDIDDGLQHLKSESSRIPNTSEDFYPVFKQTLQEMEHFANERIRQALKSLLSDFSKKIEASRSTLEEYLPKDKYDERINRIETKQKAALLRLFFGIATHPENMQKALLNVDKLKEDNALSAKADKLYPLPLKGGDYRERIFDWGKKHGKSDRIPADNEILVLRLRDEFVACAGLHLVEQVSEINKDINRKLKDYLGQIIEALQQLSKDEELFRIIFSEGSRSQASVHPLKVSLSAIANSSD